MTAPTTTSLADWLLIQLAADEAVALAAKLTPRFVCKVVVDDQDCWRWTSAVRETGYGQYFSEGRCVQAHRYAFERLRGTIAEGLVLDHICRNPGCVNPDHLEAVTDQINILRGISPIAEHPDKTECPSGHPYSGANLKIGLDGGRRCRECHRIDGRRRRQENRVADLERKRAYRLRKKAQRVAPVAGGVG